MPKKIPVSLKGIVDEIEDVTEKLEAAARSAVKPSTKKVLKIRIKKLKKMEKELYRLCRSGLNPVPPTG